MHRIRKQVRAKAFLEMANHKAEALKGLCFEI